MIGEDQRAYLVHRLRRPMTWSPGSPYAREAGPCKTSVTDLRSSFDELKQSHCQPDMASYGATRLARWGGQSARRRQSAPAAKCPCWIARLNARATCENGAPLPSGPRLTRLWYLKTVPLWTLRAVLNVRSLNLDSAAL